MTLSRTPSLPVLVQAPALASRFISAAVRTASRFIAFDGLRILLFHDLPEAQRAAFEALVSLFATQGRLSTPAEAAAILSGHGGCSRGVRFLFSFDDGFKSSFTVAASILDRYDAKGLFFVCPGLMDRVGDNQRAGIAAGIFDDRVRPNDLPPDLSLMNWADLERLATQGHAAGSHTLHHRRLNKLGPVEIEDEIAGAATILDRRLGASPDWFAYQFGDIDSIDAASLKIAGKYHRLCRSGVRGINTATTRRLALRAESIDMGRSPEWQILTAEGALDWRYRAARCCLDAYAAAAENEGTGDDRA